MPYVRRYLVSLHALAQRQALVHVQGVAALGPLLLSADYESTLPTLQWKALHFMFSRPWTIPQHSDEVPCTHVQQRAALTHRSNLTVVTEQRPVYRCTCTTVGEQLRAGDLKVHIGSTLTL